jgi:hypothetical protein
MTDELRNVDELAEFFSVHKGRVQECIAAHRIEPASRSAHGARQDQRLYRTSDLSKHLEAQQ